VGMLVVWAGLAVITKRASVASLTILAGFVPALVLLGSRGWPLIWASAMALLVVVRHSGNIRRLLTGVEPTVEADSS